MLRFSILLLIFSVVTLSLSQQSLNPQDDLDLHRLTNAIYPYRKQIQEKWTKRDTTYQEESQGPITCHLCNAVMPILRQWAKEKPDEVLQEIVIRACKLLELAPRPQEVCDPIIKAYTGQFLYIIRNSKAAVNGTNPSAQICGLLTDDCDQPLLGEWADNIDIDGNKPPKLDYEVLSPASGEPQTQIIQFTDLHVDLDYAENTTTDCGKGMPICCRVEYGYTTNKSLQAGPYGDFRCALPLNTFITMMTHAKETYPKARYVFLTGDYIHSGVWMYSKDENGRHIRNVTHALADVFTDTNVKIFPVVGNHEPHVVNMYPPPEKWSIPEFDLSWLYNDVMQPFMERDPGFLSREELLRFAKGGYYSVSPEKGLKIIVINTNLCYPENFWLGFGEYPLVHEQLQWIADTLKQAENAKENVLIVGHEEPGDCYEAWSDRFNEIVERYEGIIKGSFFGHSHKPQYRISMKKGTMNPVFSSYIAGSGLPDRMHPAYSVWHVDGERGDDSHWDVLRHELIILNLTESNSQKVPKFKKLADSYENFKLLNLKPESILDFSRRLIRDQKLIDTYLEFHTKGPDTLDARHCTVRNATCMNDIICNIVGSNRADKHACNQLKQVILENSGNDEKIENSGMVHFSGFGTVVMITLAYFLTHIRY